MTDRHIAQTKRWFEECYSNPSPSKTTKSYGFELKFYAYEHANGSHEHLGGSFRKISSHKIESYRRNYEKIVGVGVSSRSHFLNYVSRS